MATTVLMKADVALEMAMGPSARSVVLRFDVWQS